MSHRTVPAPAKLNLHLAILAREANGFHQIETLFACIDLADEIRIEPGPAGIHLTVVGAELGPPEGNLVVRAASAWCAESGSEPAFEIQLRKRIPAGAGLGGGSSDAAATLAALDEGSAAPLGRERLIALAARLGSDAPWFLAGAPFALAWGRGERCLRLPPPGNRPVLVAVADPPVATPAAYAAFDAMPTSPPPLPLPDAGALSAWDSIARLSRNDFEPVLLPGMPGARALLPLFTRHGAVLARLTGSGAAVFGIFPDASARDAAQDEVRRVHPHAWTHAGNTAF